MASTIGSVLTVVVLAVSASAQVPKGNVFIGYSYLSADTGLGRQSVNGWNASLEGKVLPFIGVVGDSAGTMAARSAPHRSRQSAARFQVH